MDANRDDEKRKMTFKPGDEPKVITSAKQLERLTKPGRYKDPEVKGLYLQIANRQNRSWLLRYQFDHKARAMGLGPYPEVGLSKARTKALEIREAIRNHRIDPLAERQEAKAARAEQQAKTQTFEQAAERFYTKSALEWRTDAQRQTFKNTMGQYVLPIIGSMNVAEVDTPAVLRVLEPIWQTKPTVANLLRIRLEAILTMATVGGFRAKGENPAQWKGHLALLLPAHNKTREVKNHAAMPYADVPGFMARLREHDDLASKALQFIILTACRKQEGLDATWDEIDLDAKLWTVPAERMKGKREHIVPLSDAAVAILDSVPRETGNDSIFIGAKAGAAMSGKSMEWGTLERLGLKGKTTVHGFRSSFRDWCGDHTEFQREVAEAALAHAVGDKTEKAYRRGDALEKRRALMEAWAAYCGSATGERGKVVDFKPPVRKSEAK